VAYLTAGLPLAAAMVAALTRGPRAFPPITALLLATPLTLVALALLLTVRYVCRAVPLEGTPVAYLLVTHGFGALLTTSLGVYVGTVLTRFISAADPATDLLSLYRFHVPGLLAGGALLYLLSASVHYTLLAVEATRRAEQQALELAMLAREAELKALKAQVHPHFLFNSLNSISALTTSDPARAREMCILLAEFFRKGLALGEQTSVSLEEELAVARTYLGIEGLRLGSRLAVEEAIDEEGKACRLPPLLLQPLVENAIRHGIATRAEGGVLRLEARTDGQNLRLLVENPFDPEAPVRRGVGLGLANVRRRLLARYGDKARLEAQPLEGRFRVTLFMPAQAEE